VKVMTQINGWGKGNGGGVMDLNYTCMFLTSELISILYTGEYKKSSPLVNLSVLRRPRWLNTVLLSENLNLVFVDPELVHSRELTHLLCLQSLVELESIWESLESLLLLLQ
jgi:hypothetical protein